MDYKALIESANKQRAEYERDESETEKQNRLLDLWFQSELIGETNYGKKPLKS